jgi:hypothetical protein
MKTNTGQLYELSKEATMFAYLISYANSPREIIGRINVSEPTQEAVRADIMQFLPEVTEQKVTIEYLGETTHTFRVKRPK